jgi:hypothetical protein
LNRGTCGGGAVAAVPTPSSADSCRANTSLGTPSIMIFVRPKTCFFGIIMNEMSTVDNMQPATCTHYTLHATLHATTRNTQYAIRNTQYAIRNTQYAIRNTQYAIRNTQYAIRNTQYAIRNNAQQRATTRNILRPKL